ncbi:FlgO family outer membrane protein [Megalodesulfovibrio paquesii]
MIWQDPLPGSFRRAPQARPACAAAILRVREVILGTALLLFALWTLPLQAQPAVHALADPPAVQAPAPQEAEPPIKIAILQFDSLGGDTKDVSRGRMVSEFMTTAAVNIGAYDVVEREALKKILDEMEYGEQGKSITSVAQKIGQLFGAQFVISGSVTGYNDSIRIDARIIRVTDGKIEFAHGSFAKNDLESIFNASKFVIEKLTELFIPSTGKMVAGQIAWTAPEALIVDGNETMWLNPKYSIKCDKSPTSCLMVKRTASGFEVNVMNCSTKWKKQEKLDTRQLLPVGNIIY